MTLHRNQNWITRCIVILLLAFVYYATAEIGRRVASTPQSVTPVWPPDGFASAAVLLFGSWVYPGILLGSFFANVWAFLNGASAGLVVVSMLKALSIGIGTTLGTLLGAFLLRRSIGDRNPLQQTQDVIRFMTMTGMIGPTVNATVGVLTLCIGGNVPWFAFLQVWLTWWVSNVAGILIFTPLVLSWSPEIHKLRRSLGNRRYSLNKQRHQRHRRRTAAFPRLAVPPIWWWLEGMLLLGMVLTVGLIAFWGGQSIEYMLIPFLMWAAFRFGQRGATLAIVLVSAIAILGTVNGYEPFIKADFNESIILLQSLLGAVVITTLVLVAALTERQTAATTLKRSETQLREQADSLEKTLDQLRNTQSQLIHTERISSLGQLVAGIAHEVNNPVSFISGNLTHVQSYTQDLTDLVSLYRQHVLNPSADIQDADIQDREAKIDLDYLLEDLPKILTSMKVGTDRIREIMASLRTFSRIDTEQKQWVDIHGGLDSTLLILHHRLKGCGDRPTIQLVKNYATLPQIECFPGQLNQVFMNLIANAIDVLEENSQVSAANQTPLEASTRNLDPKTAHSTPLPTIEIHTVAEDAAIVIRIVDNGSGIPESCQQQMFDAFFTTKIAGKGTGLGLSISRQIITEKHGGTLHCISTPSTGTEFVIKLPIRQASSVSATSQTTQIV